MAITLKCHPEFLAEEIRKELETYSTDVRRAVNEGVKSAAKITAKELRKGGPYEERTGNYTKDWSIKLLKEKDYSILTERYSVYNKKNYRLTHLLEFGHMSRNGGRVKPFEHIESAKELGEQLSISEVEKKIREIR